MFSPIQLVYVRFTAIISLKLVKRTKLKLSKRILKSHAFISVAASLIAAYIRFVGITTRWKVVNGDILKKDFRGKPFILTFWHGRLLMIPYCAPRGYRANVLNSPHSDGELMVQTLRRFGFGTIRATSGSKGKSKGGMKAIKEMIRAKQRNEPIAITPDGPKGPARKVGGNVTEIAKMLDLPIIPVTFSMTNAKIARTWDSLIIAKPFGKGIFIIGEPIPPARADELETIMNAITDEADLAVKTL